MPQDDLELPKPRLDLVRSLLRTIREETATLAGGDATAPASSFSPHTMVVMGGTVNVYQGCDRRCDDLARPDSPPLRDRAAG